MNDPTLTDKDSPWWAKLTELVIRNFGAPVALVLLILYGLYRMAIPVGTWLEGKILSPMLNAHIQQMQALSTNLGQQTDILKDMRVIDKKTQDILLENQDLIKEANQKMEIPPLVLESVQRIESKLDQKETP